MTSTTAPLTAPADQSITPAARLPFLGVEYVAVATTAKSAPHLASATRMGGRVREVDGILSAGFETLCGKRTQRMSKTHAAGREVTCKACLDGLEFRRANDAEDAAAYANHYGPDRAELEVDAEDAAKDVARSAPVVAPFSTPNGDEALVSAVVAAANMNRYVPTPSPVEDDLEVGVEVPEDTAALILEQHLAERAQRDRVEDDLEVELDEQPEHVFAVGDRVRDLPGDRTGDVVRVGGPDEYGELNASVVWDLGDGIPRSYAESYLERLAADPTPPGAWAVEPEAREDVQGGGLLWHLTHNGEPTHLSYGSRVRAVDAMLEHNAYDRTRDLAVTAAGQPVPADVAELLVDAPGTGAVNLPLGLPVRVFGYTHRAPRSAHNRVGRIAAQLAGRTYLVRLDADGRRPVREVEATSDELRISDRVLADLSRHLEAKADAWGSDTLRLPALDAAVEQAQQRARGGHPGPARRTTSVRFTDEQYRRLDAAVEAGFGDGLNAVLARLIDEHLTAAVRTAVERA